MTAYWHPTLPLCFEDYDDYPTEPDPLPPYCYECGQSGGHHFNCPNADDEGSEQ